MDNWNWDYPRFLGYTYENMQNDLGIFARIFPEYLQVQSLGKSADLRKIDCMRIGKQNAQQKVFIFGGIHGREYMTCQLLMEQAAKFLLHLKYNRVYKGVSYEKLLENRAIYVIPMANPDGVSISQFGENSIRNPGLRRKVLQIAEKERKNLSYEVYFRKWKANARGVDLNRNFPADWDKYTEGRGEASSEKYKGAYPESEEETRILTQLTREAKFQRTLSYHSSGQVIYWNFGQEGVLKERTKNFADRIAEVTGYKTDGNFEKLDAAGYKDWALQSMKIPSLTVEIGKPDSPLPWWCFEAIYRENRRVWEEMLLDLEKENSPRTGKYGG